MYDDVKWKYDGCNLRTEALNSTVLLQWYIGKLALLKDFNENAVIVIDVRYPTSYRCRNT